MNFTDPFDAAHRARVVAGIRALADLIEANTFLPVPDGVDAQYSITRGLDEDGRQLVHDVAAELGVVPRIAEDLATARFTVSENDWKAGESYFRVEYIVHGSRRDQEAVASRG